MGRSAFAVYVVHSLVLVLLTVALAGIPVHPLLKFLLLLTVGTAASFAVAEGLRRVPLLRRVF